MSAEIDINDVSDKLVGDRSLQDILNGDESLSVILKNLFNEVSCLRKKIEILERIDRVIIDKKYDDIIKETDK